MSADLFVATVVAPAGIALSDAQIAGVAERIAQSGGVIERVSWFDGGRAADVFYRAGEGTAHAQLCLAASDGIDIIIQPAANRRKKLLIADMESTVIDQEMLDELAMEVGIGEQVASITRRAMNGELDFAAALAERVALLAGQPEGLLDIVAARMTVTSGAAELVAAIHKNGGQAWLVSGGFTCFVKKIAEKLGFDRFFANHLMLEKGCIAGRVESPILDKMSKKFLLEQACAAYGCGLADAVAVGDGANDIPMLQACAVGGGLGVAYRAKPAVRAVIAQQINAGDLSVLVYAMGTGAL